MHSPAADFAADAFERKLTSLLESKSVEEDLNAFGGLGGRRKHPEPVNRKIFVPPSPSTSHQPTPKKTGIPIQTHFIGFLYDFSIL